MGYLSTLLTFIILIAAQAVAVVQSSLVFYACSRGFGTSISLLKYGRLDQIQAVSYHSISYYLVSMAQTEQLP